MADSDTRLTPPWLLDLVRQMGPVQLDPCAAEASDTGARYALYLGDGLYRREHGGLVWYQSDTCGLDLDWWQHACCGGDGPVWVNPPYSRGRVTLWAEKCVTEARDGCEIVLLTQADVSTRWFRYLRENADSVCLLHRRVGFLLPDGAQMPGAKFGSALWYWGPRRSRFRRVFGPHGWVVDCPGPQDVGQAEGDRAAE